MHMLYIYIYAFLVLLPKPLIEREAIVTESTMNFMKNHWVQRQSIDKLVLSCLVTPDLRK